MRKKLLSVALCATMVAGLQQDVEAVLRAINQAQKKGSVYWLNFKPEADEAYRSSKDIPEGKRS